MNPEGNLPNIFTALRPVDSVVKAEPETPESIHKRFVAILKKQGDLVLSESKKRNGGYTIFARRVMRMRDIRGAIPNAHGQMNLSLKLMSTQSSVSSEVPISEIGEQPDIQDDQMCHVHFTLSPSQRYVSYGDPSQITFFLLCGKEQFIKI